MLKITLSPPLPPPVMWMIHSCANCFIDQHEISWWCNLGVPMSP